MQSETHTMIFTLIGPEPICVLVGGTDMVSTWLFALVAGQRSYNANKTRLTPLVNTWSNVTVLLRLWIRERS